MLMEQPSAMPTRKMWAVIIAGACIGAAQTALALLWPEHPFTAMFEIFDVLIQGAVMSLAGYYVLEKAPVTGPAKE